MSRDDCMGSDKSMVTDDGMVTDMVAAPHHHIVSDLDVGLNGIILEDKTIIAH